MIEILQIASALAVGLLMGSLLTEAMILVPYWRAMKAEEFLSLHHTMGPQLYQYFAPLTILATMLPLVTALLPLLLGEPLNLYSVVSAGLLLTMLVIYFWYFKGANESFGSGTVGVDGLAAELARWASWHWLRVTLGMAAFLASLLALG